MITEGTSHYIQHPPDSKSAVNVRVNAMLVSTCYYIYSHTPLIQDLNLQKVIWKKNAAPFIFMSSLDKDRATPKKWVASVQSGGMCLGGDYELNADR